MASASSGSCNGAANSAEENTRVSSGGRKSSGRFVAEADEAFAFTGKQRIEFGRQMTFGAELGAEGVDTALTTLGLAAEESAVEVAAAADDEAEARALAALAAAGASAAEAAAAHAINRTAPAITR